jgi:hypothetical protein
MAGANSRISRPTSRRGSGGVPGARLECNLAPESLVTLVRRLLQADDPTAESLAAGICQTLGLELVWPFPTVATRTGAR